MKEIVKNICEKYSSRTVLVQGRGAKRRECTYSELYEMICAAVKWLGSKGICGEKICVAGRNSIEYAVLFFAVQISGNTLIPLSERYSREDIRYITENSGCGVVIADDSMEDFFTAESGYDLIGTEELVQAYEDHRCGDMESTKSDISMIVYTSGTSGSMNGVMLSMKNITDSFTAFAKVCRISGKVIFSLPVNHLYAWGANFFLPFSNGLEMTIAADTKEFFRLLMVLSPEYIFTVPMELEMFMKMIRKDIGRYSLGSSYEGSLEEKREHYRKAYAFLGNNIKKLYTAGAVLDGKLASQFYDVGLALGNIYGSTECSPFVSYCDDPYDGSIGEPVECCELKVEDNELLVRGSNVMSGYYGLSEKTAEVITDGWYHTGDIISFTEKGRMVVTGRKRNIIVLSSGENISPEETESKIKNFAGVKEVIVYSEGGRLTAEIFAEDGYEDDIRENIRQISSSLPEYRRITEVKFRDVPFEKTAINKIKRKKPDECY